MTTLDISKYRFLDVGCGAGTSLALYGRLFGAEGQGIGIDADLEKVELARQAGHRAELVDVGDDFKPRGKVEFCVMAHLLEHLSDLQVVRTIVARTTDIASQFVIIRQPWFDSDAYLFRHGLRLYWTNWSGHPNHMTLLQLYNLIEPLRQQQRVSRFSFYGINPIEDSSSPFVLNLDEPRDQHRHTEGKHGEKRHVRFREPVFEEVLAILDIDGSSTRGVKRRFPGCRSLFDSSR